MEESSETQEGLFVMKWRNFIPMLFFVVLSTNTASIFYHNQNKNANLIEYNKERSDKISNRHLQEAKNFFILEELKKELEKCKKTKR